MLRRMLCGEASRRSKKYVSRPLGVGDWVSGECATWSCWRRRWRCDRQDLVGPEREATGRTNSTVRRSMQHTIPRVRSDGFPPACTALLDGFISPSSHIHRITHPPLRIRSRSGELRASTGADPEIQRKNIVVHFMHPCPYAQNFRHGVVGVYRRLQMAQKAGINHRHHPNACRCSATKSTRSCRCAEISRTHRFCDGLHRCNVTLHYMQPSMCASG